MTILQKKGLPDFRQAVLFFAEYVCKIVLQHVFLFHIFLSVAYHDTTVL